MSSALVAVSEPGAAEAAADPAQPGSGHRWSWPFLALFWGTPIWFVLGLQSLIWIILGVPMALALFSLRRIRFPKGFGLWLVFFAWMLLSATQLERNTQLVAFTYRALVYAVALVVLLFVFNAPRRLLSDRAIGSALLAFWGYAIIGGWLGLVLGDASFTSIVELVLPRGLTQHEFVQGLVHPSFAQVQVFLGFDLPRPTAPFVYTNDWGANLGLLFPIVFASWRLLADRGRGIVLVLLIASVIPVVMSVNRGLWVSIAIGGIYGAAVLAARGDYRPLAAAGIAAAAILLVVLLTPLRGVVESRFESDHSNETRLGLYSQVQTDVAESPLLGFGSPRSNEENPNHPAVGTHGHFWTVLFSHGLPGAFLFVAAVGSLVLRTAFTRRDSGVWLHVVVALVLVEMWFYSLLPSPLIIVMAVAGASLRGWDSDRRGAEPERHSYSDGPFEDAPSLASLLEKN